MFRHTVTIIILTLFSCSQFLYSNPSENSLKDHFFLPDVTSLSVSDWCNPTIEDYRSIQKFIKNKVAALAHSPIHSRPFSNDFLNTDFYGWITYRMNRAELVGYDDDTHLPSSHTIYFNGDPNNKKNCIICYASYPCPGPGYRDYAKGIGYIIESLKKHNFDGHFIYYIGGWPNVKNGRLKYADVPYSFKPFFFEEVRDLGYQNVLWIDACTIPVKNLYPVFDFIERNGLCFYGFDSYIPWNEFNIAYKELMPFIDLNQSYKDIVSQVVGLNLKESRGLQLLDAWIKAAEEKVPFLPSDQPSFGFLINNFNLLHGQLPLYCMVETACNTGNFAYWHANPYAYFYHQYDFVNPEYDIPSDLFSH